jgi:hypothetical protein
MSLPLYYVNADGTVLFAHTSEEDGGGIGTCACYECVKLDWDALDDDRPRFAQYLKDFREATGPVVTPATNTGA